MCVRAYVRGGGKPQNKINCVHRQGRVTMSHRIDVKNWNIAIGDVSCCLYNVMKLGVASCQHRHTKQRCQAWSERRNIPGIMPECTRRIRLARPNFHHDDRSFVTKKRRWDLSSFHKRAKDVPKQRTRAPQTNHERVFAEEFGHGLDRARVGQPGGLQMFAHCERGGGWG